MKMVDRHLGKCCHLFEEFARLFRESDDYAEPNGDDRARELLQRWMAEARESEIVEIEAFAAKLFQDIEAVAAAMVWPYSLRDKLRVGSTSSSSSRDRCTDGVSSIC